MYGLNNNTGLPQSQQDNGWQKLKKGIHSAKGYYDPLQKMKSNSGFERLTGIAELAMQMMSKK